MIGIPRCKCGATGGLLFRDDRWWCADCVWAEIDRLHVALDGYGKELGLAQAENKIQQVIIDKLLLGIESVGKGLFSNIGWREAKAEWWQELLAAVKAAEAAKGDGS